MRGRIPGVVAAVLLTVLTATSGPAVGSHPVASAAAADHAAEAGVNEVAEAVVDPAARQCPEVVVLAARGSEQNTGLEPTRYSEQAPWVSNGYEGENLRALLLAAEQRHLARTGESLMADVQVLALDEEIYPAALPLPALAEAGEELSPVETARRLGAILADSPAHVIAEDAATAFAASVYGAATGTGDLLLDYEAQAGCEPGYLLLGYSQGAMVLTPQEEPLHDAGRLAGAVYLGNPLLAPGDPGTIVGSDRGGALRAVPGELRPGARTGDRLNYCAHGDFVCDPTVDSLSSGLAGHGGEHARYFLNDPASAEDAVVLDRFADLINGYTSQP